MANRTAWTAGNSGNGLSWFAAFNTTDFTTSNSSSYLATGQTVLSSASAIANGTNLDQFMDISSNLAIASSTIAAGANLAFWIYYLNEDGTTYGDGLLTAGAAASHVPPFPPAGIVYLYAAGSQTALVGSATGIVLAPGSFLLAMQNNSGFTLSGATQTVKIRTYNVNLNS